MSHCDRRYFLKASAGGLLSTKASPLLAGGRKPVKAGETNGFVHVEGGQYLFEWSAPEDRFWLRDKKKRVITLGTMQPAVVVAPSTSDPARRCVSGRVASHEVRDGALTINYERVNGAARLIVTWRFDESGLWLDPFIYETPASEDIVSVHYFASCKSGNPKPSLGNNYLIFPGISESSAISPVVPSVMGLNLTGWLGHGSFGGPGLFQQWGLPAHYFCGFHRNAPFNRKGAIKEDLSDAFCCGLAELPAGDFLFQTRGGKHGPVLNYRSDLWKSLRGPGHLSLGAKWRWSIGPNYYEAIRRYYLDLVESGIIQQKKNSPRKNSTVLSPQFNTWGAEVAAGKDWGRFDGAFLSSTYQDLKASGMKPGMFVVDAKWEGKYGLLEHSAERFPHFEETLKRIRSDGHLLGMWAAFMRCEDPRDMGLTTEHMLHHPDSTPIVIPEGVLHYYLLDFTQPEVQEALTRQARKFIRRYQPDLVKFDFGYELPSLNVGAPKDMRWAGERLLKKGLEVVINAMREENPDVVVMYYSLSPLFIEYFDLHSPDDMFVCAKEYGLEANRRFFFSSLLGEIGMPTYGSGGYDWDSMPEIWFDSAVVGTLGSLNTFQVDEEDEGPTPERMAKYNGLARLVRPSNVFSIRPIGAEYVSPTRTAHSPSWARIENQNVVLLALRGCGWFGRKAVAEYDNLAQTTASVVVASKTDEGIQRASRLAIVPYGVGEVRITRDRKKGKSVEIIEHCWGNRIRKKEGISVENGMLIIPLRERTEDGSPVEWIEVNL
ncbi:MAG: hypothetical protein ACRD18_10360 [Terriglobia bacterium]